MGEIVLRTQQRRGHLLADSQHSLAAMLRPFWLYQRCITARCVCSHFSVTVPVATRVILGAALSLQSPAREGKSK